MLSLPKDDSTTRPGARCGFHLQDAMEEHVDSEFCTLIVGADRGQLPARGLFATLYSELHRLAKRELARNRGMVTLGATTLLHEAYLELAQKSGSTFPDRARFMGYAARVMRGLIIDHARNRRAQKRGGMFELTSLEPDTQENIIDCRDLTRVADSLDELEKLDASLAELVDLKFFCGFSFLEIATMRGISERTVQRDWEKARIYLHHSIRAKAV